MTDLAIIGGGAAGMAAGILAAGGGLSVLILEKNERFGKKIGATGNGKCNFTNAVQTPDCYRGSEPLSAWAIVRAFSVTQTLSFFSGLGVEPKERNGYYYPGSGQAADMTAVMTAELVRLHVKCKTNQRVTGISGEKGRFSVETEGYAYRAERVLLAAGGMASPIHGTDGDGFCLAGAAGHRMVPPVPALTALTPDGSFINGLAGLRTAGRIRIFAEPEGLLLAGDCGELQFTKHGISGIPAMQVSRFAARSLADGHRVAARLDFLPDCSYEEAALLLRRRKSALGWKRTADWFTGWIPEKLALALLRETGVSPEIRAQDLSEKELERLAGGLKDSVLPIRAVRPFPEAQTTAGGVPLTECTPYLESLLRPGLYFAGEVLDVDGACGGYNLQWAWSSAACTVRGILQERGNQDV